MNKPEAVNWKSFKETLAQHPDLTLQFQYAENQWVDPSYHITEIKQAPIVSVDCGGVMNSWTEIIVQLWEPEPAEQERAMTVSKALSIVDLVEKSLPLNPLATVKIEFGNSQFDTRQLFPNDFIISGGNLIIDLRPGAVQCKAMERGESCGTKTTGEECCPAEKPKVELINFAAGGDVCTPGSGCC
ncbi:DUF6428 family protein [Pedobacter sp. AW31-3R]|uniref:DUF6428 family protein n=1 Tax=Pedobacter sp. AW31-3R TaxID=3445781 RepID=UPI003F9EBD95